jgi:hypothetical protein
MAVLLSMADMHRAFDAMVHGIFDSCLMGKDPFDRE